MWMAARNVCLEPRIVVGRCCAVGADDFFDIVRFVVWVWMVSRMLRDLLD